MPLNLDRVQALCFDVDGTLHDTDDQFVERLASVLGPARMLFPDFNAQPVARRLVMALEAPGNALFNWLDKLGVDHRINRLQERFYRAHWLKRPEPYRLIPGVMDMLLCLRESYPLSVVSARATRTTLRFLDHFELTPLFAAIATAHTTPRTKPSPDPIYWAAARMNVAPHHCLMIGDTTVDMRAGKAAGAQTVGVLCGFGGRAALERAGADMILDSTADLLEILIPGKPSNLADCNAVERGNGLCFV
jgi:HAD superfamily hydrolase (TIGR01549 family)